MDQSQITFEHLEMDGDGVGGGMERCTYAVEVLAGDVEVVEDRIGEEGGSLV
jgi:hypothetical protein